MLPLGNPDNGGTLAGAQVYPVADLALANSLAATASLTSTPFFTGNPATVHVFGKTASGSVTCKLAIAATSGALNFASGTTDATFTSSAVTVDIVDTTAASLWCGIKLTDSGTSSSFVGGTFYILVVYGLTAGENWSSVKTGRLATASTVRGDGSGVITRTVA